MPRKKYTRKVVPKTPTPVVSPAELAELEAKACKPIPVDVKGFNPNAKLPYGMTATHVQTAMEAFVDFLGFLNAELSKQSMERLETMLMPANYSSIVGEFMTSSIPKACQGLVKNKYHNGHPDMLPTGMYPNDEGQHVAEGVEVKGSRYLKSWQGHNAEDVWLLVFVFDSNRPTDSHDPPTPAPNKNGKPKKAPTAVLPKPFRFVKVVGAKIDKADWKFDGRKDDSRRTPTATVLDTGFKKMEDNWIYRDPSLNSGDLQLDMEAADGEAAHPEDSDNL